MNNVITNSKVAISDWISPNYEKNPFQKKETLLYTKG